MQIHTPAYGLFLLAFVVLFHVARRRPDLARLVVIAATLVFYGSWSLAFVPVLLASTLVTFQVARAMSATDDAVRKRRLMTAGIVFCVGLLVVFKYVNFVLENAYTVMHWAGWHGTEVYVDLFFPLGISFFTFVNIAYLIDVHRGQVAAKQRLVEYLAPMTFFPQLVSGPIARAGQLFPQFDRLDGIQQKSYRLALLLIFVGIAKKALAGMLDPVTSALYSADGPLGQLETWTGVIAYTSQIYADFSGYVDIAMGAALLVGIELPPNFNLPFLATSPIDFWRRWHITLSSWIHDYGFLPLVRKLRRTYLSLMLVWLAAGIWHGAQWTFVFHGLFWGIAIIVTRWIGLHAPEAIHERADAWPLLTLRRVSTFVVVSLGLIFFRAPDLSHIGKITSSLVVSSGSSAPRAETMVTLGLVALSLLVPHLLDAAILHRRDSVLRAWFWPIAVFAAFFAIIFGTGAGGYIYFRF